MNSIGSSMSSSFHSVIASLPKPQLLWLSPHTAPKNILAKVRGEESPKVLRLIENMIARVTPCLTPINSRRTLEGATQTLFITFTSQTSSDSDKTAAAAQFYKTFAARVKIFDPHHTLSLSNIMQQYIGQECERRKSPKQLHNAILSQLTPYRHLQPILGATAALATAGALLYSFTSSPKVALSSALELSTCEAITPRPALLYAQITMIALPVIISATLAGYCRYRSSNQIENLNPHHSLPQGMLTRERATGFAEKDPTPPASTSSKKSSKRSDSSNDSKKSSNASNHSEFEMIPTPPAERENMFTRGVNVLRGIAGRDSSSNASSSSGTVSPEEE